MGNLLMYVWYTKILIFYLRYTCLITSHGLPSTSCGSFHSGLCLLKFKAYSTTFHCISILLCMLSQNIDSLASILVFSMPIWLMCSCPSTHFCSTVRITIPFFIPIMSIMAGPSLIIQYCLMFCWPYFPWIANLGWHTPLPFVGLHLFTLCLICHVFTCKSVCQL